MNRDRIQWINSTLKELDDASGSLNPKNHGCATALTAIGHAADCLKSLREHLETEGHRRVVTEMVKATGRDVFSDEAIEIIEALASAGYRKAGDQ